MTVNNSAFLTGDPQPNEVIAGNQRIILTGTQFSEMFAHNNAAMPVVTGSVSMPFVTPLLIPIISQSDHRPFVGQFTIPATVQLASHAARMPAPSIRMQAPSVRMPPPLSPVQHSGLSAAAAFVSNVQSSNVNRSMSGFNQVALSNGAKVCLPKNCTIKVIQRHPTESHSVISCAPISCKTLPVKSSPKAVVAPRTIPTTARTMPSTIVTTKNTLNGRVVSFHNTHCSLRIVNI